MLSICVLIIVYRAYILAVIFILIPFLADILDIPAPSFEVHYLPELINAHDITMQKRKYPQGQ